MQNSCAIPIHVCFLFVHHCQAAVFGLGQQNNAQIFQGFSGVLVDFSGGNICQKRAPRKKMSIYAAVREIFLIIQKKPENHLPKLKYYSKYRSGLFYVHCFFQFWKMPNLPENFNIIL